MHSINILKYYYIFYGNGGVEIDTIEVEQKYISASQTILKILIKKIKRKIQKKKLTQI